MAKVLSSFGIIVVLPDYRNFPQGTVSDMLVDVDQSLNWVMANIEQFGGDSGAIFVTGQSAGAHLGLLAILRKARREFEEEKSHISGGADSGRIHGWRTSQVAAFIGIAGPYNVKDLQEGFKARGMSRRLLWAIMGGEENLESFSADYVINNELAFEKPEVIKRVPPIILLHGTADTCVPHQASRRTAEALGRAGIRTFLRFYPQKSHTDSIIEDLVYAEDPTKEDMMTDIVAMVLAKNQVLSVLPKVSYEIQQPLDQPNEYERPRRSSSHFSETPILVDDETIYSSSEEFEVHVDSEDEHLRPSFLRPAIEKPQDFDLKKIRRSIMPRILWRWAKLANPF